MTSAPEAAPAVGIHTHPTRKLGARPPIPGRAKLAFGDFLKVMPAHPLVDTEPHLTWPMDHNDNTGICVPAAADHTLQAICALLGVPRPNWTDGELLAYYQTQNPKFKTWADSGGPNDQGMVIQLFLEYLVKKGVILGFAGIDPTKADEVQAAVYLGLAIITGESLTVAQQSQQTWDYVPGSPDWGGHCTTWVGYGAGLDRCVTWGEVVPMTAAFVDRQVSEAYFVVTQPHVDHPGFRDHFDLPAFAAAYTAMTHRPFPVVAPIPTPPTPPPPPPGPTPDPGDASFQQALASVVGLPAWVAKQAAHHQMSVPQYVAWRLAGDANLR